MHTCACMYVHICTSLFTYITRKKWRWWGKTMLSGEIDSYVGICTCIWVLHACMYVYVHVQNMSEVTVHICSYIVYYVHITCEGVAWKTCISVCACIYVYVMSASTYTSRYTYVYECEYARTKHSSPNTRGIDGLSSRLYRMENIMYVRMYMRMQVTCAYVYARFQSAFF